MSSYAEEAKFSNVGSNPIYWDASVAKTSSPLWSPASSISISPETGTLTGGGTIQSIVITVNNKDLDADADPYYAVLSLAAYKDEEKTVLLDTYQWSVKVDVIKGSIIMLGADITFGFLVGDTVVQTATRELKNNGAIDISWTGEITGDASGVASVLPLSGDLVSDESENLIVTASPVGLAAGKYNGELVITSDDTNPTGKDIFIEVSKVFTGLVKCAYVYELIDTDHPLDPPTIKAGNIQLDWMDVIPVGFLGWGDVDHGPGVDPAVRLYRSETAYVWRIGVRHHTSFYFPFVSEVISPTFREADGYPSCDASGLSYDLASPRTVNITWTTLIIGPDAW